MNVVMPNVQVTRSPSVSERDDILTETAQARSEAKRLLQGLIEARAQSEARLAELNRVDILKKLTGTSALDTAIGSTERMIETLDRVLGDIESKLTPDEMALLKEALAE
ncbi:MAG: hypothetical protein AAFR76_09410 [Planctomycetota bacterium]